MVLTLTLNPAIDRTIIVDKLVYEDRAYIRSTTESPGGRGLNASRVLASFGMETVSLVTAGGESGSKLVTLLNESGFAAEVVRVRSSTRTNLTIYDKQGLTLKLNEVGGELETAELQQMRHAVESRLSKAVWLMLCGSLPPGVPLNFYAELIELANSQGVKTFLDTDDGALRCGIEARPTVVKPNQPEAERLLGRALISRGRCAEAARSIQALGAGTVLLSLGSRGIVACSGEGDQAVVWEVVPPRVEALSPIGAGDAVAAAFVYATRQGSPLLEAVQLAAAAGTASALKPGMEFATLAEAKAMMKRLETRNVTNALLR